MIRWGAVYFAVVFAVGFVLGIVRVGLLEPRLGTRWAELAEMPLMFLAMWLASRWVVRRTGDPLATPAFTRLDYMGIGAVALGLLLAAECSLVFLQGSSIAEYIASRDPVSGSVYAAMLILFAAMPLIVSAIGKRR